MTRRWSLVPAAVALSVLAACSSEDETNVPQEGDFPPDNDSGVMVLPLVDSGSPSDAAVTGSDAGPVIPKPPVGGCEQLTFPSGVTFQTKPDANLTASYANISDNGDYPKPKCFIDVDDLTDPKTGVAHDINVMVSAHFTLAEYVRTELPYSHRVLLSPILVAKMEQFRVNLGRSVSLSSGYRSPPHQRAVCRSICGKDACPPRCAERSRHSWGDAADIPESPTKALGDTACLSKFNYVYREGDHLHNDLNPAHPVCTIDVL